MCVSLSRPTPLPIAVLRTAQAALAAMMLLAGLSRPAEAQTLNAQQNPTVMPPPPPYAQTVSLSGPRFGMTLLSDGVIDKLKDRDIEVGPNISQFGWQFEKQFYTRDSGVTAVTEWVGLVGGLDQSVVLPSLTWMVGLRTHDGAEFGLGPNVTPAGTAMAFAAGMTFRTGPFNIPLNVAVVPSKAGNRVSVLTGFNMRR